MLKAGFGRAEITPQTGAELVGYHSKRFVTGVLDPLYVRALIVEEQTPKLVLLVLDLMAVERAQTEAIRAHLSQSLGLAGGSVVVTCTHTHTGPPVFDFFESEAVPGYVENTLLPAAERACREAIEQAGPFELRFGRAREHGLAFCRRFVMKDGRVMTNPPKGSPGISRPESEIDHDVQVLAFERDGELAGLLVDANNHCDTIGGSEISADWPGWMARFLGERLGRDMPVLLLNGPAGNINHFDPNNPERQASYVEAERLGRGYGGFVLEALNKAEAIPADTVTAESETFQVPYRRVPPEEIERARKTAPHKPDTSGRPITSEDLAKGHPYWDWVIAREIVAFNDKYRGQVSERVELCGFRIGECAFVGLPGEPFSEIGMAVKRRSPFDRTCVFGLCGDMAGYVPMPEHFGKGGYEPLTGAYNRFVPEAANLFICHALEVLGRLG